VIRASFRSHGGDGQAARRSFSRAEVTSSDDTEEAVDELGRPALCVLLYLGAFLLAPVLLGAGGIAKKILEVRSAQVSPPFEQALPAPPTHDPARLTAVVLMSNWTTENTAYLAAFEVLAASGAFTIYALAPERKLSPLFPARSTCCRTTPLRNTDGHSRARRI
jgi:hypothetical protein